MSKKLGFLLFDWIIKCFEIAVCACGIELVFYSCSYWCDAILQFKSVNVRPRNTLKTCSESQHKARPDDTWRRLQHKAASCVLISIDIWSDTHVCRVWKGMECKSVCSPSDQLVTHLESWQREKIFQISCSKNPSYSHRCSVIILNTPRKNDFQQHHWVFCKTKRYGNTFELICEQQQQSFLPKH